MAKKAWLRFLLPGVLILIVGVGLLVKFGIERAAAEEVLAKFPDRGVPRMNITLNGVTLDEINAGSKETKYEGNEVTIYEGDNATLEASGVRVKGRGNGSWNQEKKPYQIKFSSKVGLFGMGKAKKWVLLANAADASNLRTEMAFLLEEMLGMEYPLSGKFVEIYYNGDYEGLYYLTRGVEVDKRVVDLKDPMGVLAELDNLYWNSEIYYDSSNGDKLVVKDLKAKDNLDIAMNDFMLKYNELEKAIKEKSFEEVKSIIDVASFAKYYLLNEFIVNPDAYWTSFYMYKDGVEDVIHAGPGWDFDVAFGNRKWCNWQGEILYSPTQTMIRKREFQSKDFYDEQGIENGYEASIRISHLLYDLMDMPDFRDSVAMAFKEKMSGKKEEFVSFFLKRADEIEQLARYDNEKWKKGDYDEEIRQMAEWIGARYDYFEEEYGDGHDELEAKNKS